jgi:hypothetical protein
MRALKIDLQSPVGRFPSKAGTPNLDPTNLDLETWFDAQVQGAFLIGDLRAAWDHIETTTGSKGVLDLPARWLGTELLLEIHKLAEFVVSSAACGNDSIEELSRPLFLETFTAIWHVTRVDAHAVLRDLCLQQHDALQGKDWKRFERLGARIAYTAQEFARCAHIAIRELPKPEPEEAVGVAALMRALQVADAGRHFGDPRAARLFDVIVSLTKTMVAGGLLLPGVRLPVQISHGRGSHSLALDANVRVIEKRVLRGMAALGSPRGAAGAAFLHIALFRGMVALGPGKENSFMILSREALTSCWEQGSSDPPLSGIRETAKYARDLALRSLTALGIDTEAIVASEVQAVKRGKRAREFREMTPEARWRRVQTLLRNRDDKVPAVAQYLGVPIEDVRAVISAGKPTHPKAS